MRKKKLLVVDDDPIIREVCETNLSLAGFEVETADNGESATKMMRRTIPDLVVLGSMMPRFGGDKMLNQIRRHENTKNLPVIFLAARGSVNDVLEGLRLGANDYLIKPVSIKSLLDTVSSCLDRHYLLNSGEEDWKRRSGGVSHFFSVRIQKSEDISGALWFLTRDLRTPNIKGLKVGLFEALTNAVYHGNLELSSEIKKGKNGFARYDELAEKRQNDPRYGNRWVTVTSRQDRNHVKFEVTDEGPGFNWLEFSDNDGDMDDLELSGRGILMMRFYYQNIEWNEKGNGVTLFCSFENNNGKSLVE